MLEKISDEMVADLYAVFTKLESEKDAEILLKDLCSINEILQMAQRLRAAKLLLQGKTYAEVNALTGASSATLSRVSACTQYGAGGYQKFLK
ncbi:MAG: YerC/YecD family TrpR-related protein [Clostridia bacterium]